MYTQEKPFWPTTADYEKHTADNSRVRLILHDDVELSCLAKPPSREALKRFFATNDDPSRRLGAFENLCIDSVVWPAADVLRQQFEQFAGLPLAYGDQLLSMTGISKGGAATKKAQ